MALDSVYKLHVVSGADEGEIVALSGSSIRLVGGATTGLDVNEGCLSIKDRAIGGLQAVLTWDKEKKVYRLSNRSAFSPVVVNGKACAHAFLVDRTTISVGNSVLQVEAPEGYKEQTNANICEIGSNTREEAVYLGAPPVEQPAKSFTPAWLRRGDDAPEPPALSMEHVTSENYLGHHEVAANGLAGALSADERARLYAPASRAGRLPGPQPRPAAVDPDIEDARKLGIDLAVYKQAKVEGFDPVLYAQAYNEGIDPYVYVQACQDGQDPHLYAQAYSVGLDPQTYIETLNQGYNPFAAAQIPNDEITPTGDAIEEDYQGKDSEEQASYAGFESEGEGFGHLFAPPPSLNLEKPVAFDTPKPTPIFEAQTIVSSGENTELSEQNGVESEVDDYKYEVVSSPEEHKDGERPRGRLVVVYGADRGLTLDVYGNVTIGRANNNDLVLSDLSVSRQHCSVQFLEDGVYLVNHSTSSTTKVGRMPIKRRARLTQENTITLANKVRIHWESYE